MIEQWIKYGKAVLICRPLLHLLLIQECISNDKYGNKIENDFKGVLFVLRFYGPVNPMGSCQGRTVYLTTRLLGRLSPLSGYSVLCTFFRQKVTTALLETAEGREWPQKIFHDQSLRKNVADLFKGVKQIWTNNQFVFRAVRSILASIQIYPLNHSRLRYRDNFADSLG